MRDKQANSDARHVIGVRRVVPHHHNVLKNTPYRSQDLRHDIHAMTIIRHAIFPEDTAAVLSIWREFIANSPVNLDYQNNDAEFANLPGKYAPPNGCVLLADREGEFEAALRCAKSYHRSVMLTHVGDSQSGETMNLCLRVGGHCHGCSDWIARRL
ncbi:hypothetical protein [Sphingobium sp. Ant17]|uniref:hypothetical protein n=1 Tax=Sphingobium sp. Ant17 TaxID=1461752 RepID=UPI00190F6FD4|nr:hypothetical protein [Sphingobium sp. Ant17]